METDTVDYLSIINLFLLLGQIDWSFVSYIALLLILIACSGMISASEVGFFSLSPTTIRALEESEEDKDKNILKLRAHPKKLLATILISNNFVNVAIIIVSDILLKEILTQEVLNKIGLWLYDHVFASSFLNPEKIAVGFNFFITTILVTFVLLLFGEVGPKIFANLNNLKISRIMAAPLSFLNFLFSPISSILVRWGNIIERRIAENRNYQTGTSKEDLDHAIELTVSQNEEEQQDAELLKGILKFGEMSARQVMKPRVDIVAIEASIQFDELLKIATDAGYSRLPVYDEDFDNIKGILYVKDLIGVTSEGKNYNWSGLVRSNLLYIPETKKIDDLLRDFQTKRLHMAIVVDEFGGTLGIVTLEDIMEEVIGEINDETDEEDEIDYVKLSDGNYIFDGKTLLNDLCRIIGEKTSYFDDIKGNGDSIGGLIIELLGHIPKIEKEITIKDLKIKVISSTPRRIEKVNIKVN